MTKIARTVVYYDAGIGEPEAYRVGDILPEYVVRAIDANRSDMVLWAAPSGMSDSTAAYIEQEF